MRIAISLAGLGVAVGVFMTGLSLSYPDDAMLGSILMWAGAILAIICLISLAAALARKFHMSDDEKAAAVKMRGAHRNVFSESLIVGRPTAVDMQDSAGNVFDRTALIDVSQPEPKDREPRRKWFRGWRPSKKKR
jgi:hypothetical protein